MDSSNTTSSFIESYHKQLNSFCLPERLAGSYELRDCLKQSSKKDIYLLSDEKENQFILKCGTGKQAALIKQEYHISTQLESIQGLMIPEYIDFFEEEETCYLLRRYIEGCSIADYFEKRLYFTDIEIIDIMLEICHLIQLLHMQKPPIIHRDIKPENFIIQKGTGTLYLVDFDTARVFAPEKSRDTMLIGTPSHAAPEQFGFSQSDVRTDIYALGKTLLYLTYGSTEVKDLKSTSIARPFQKMIARCTDFVPNKRYSDVSQLSRSLKHYRTHLNFLKSYARQLAVSVLILALGIGIGYITGSLQSEQYSTHFISNGDNTSQTDMPSDENNASQTEAQPSDVHSTSQTEAQPSDANGSSLSETNDTDNTMQETASDDASLLEQSGALECDLLQYMDMVDQIILDYYNYDTDAVAQGCEALVTALYEDEALNQRTGTDYYNSEKDFGSPYRACIVQIRDSLAYRNGILKQNLGSYASYKEALYMSLNGYLDPSIINVKSGLYIYATSSGEESRQCYQDALSDMLYNILNAFDIVDGVN